MSSSYLIFTRLHTCVILRVFSTTVWRMCWVWVWSMPARGNGRRTDALADGWTLIVNVVEIQHHHGALVCSFNTESALWFWTLTLGLPYWDEKCKQIFFSGFRLILAIFFRVTRNSLVWHFLPSANHFSDLSDSSKPQQRRLPTSCCEAVSAAKPPIGLCESLARLARLEDHFTILSALLVYIVD